MYVAISAAGAFRTDDGGETWKPINRGLKSAGPAGPECRGRSLRAPDRDAPFAPQRAVHAEALGRDAERRAGDPWHEVSGNLPSDFGFPIDVHAHEPETIYVVPIKSDTEHYPPEGKLRVYRSRTGGDEWEALTNGLPQSDCYVNVLRDAMAVDTLDSCGIYFGTTGGQVYARPTAATTGRRSSATCRRWCRWRCRRSHDPRSVCPSATSAPSRAVDEKCRSKSTARRRSAPSSMRWSGVPVLRGTIRDHSH